MLLGLDRAQLSGSSQGVQQPGKLVYQQWRKVQRQLNRLWLTRPPWAEPDSLPSRGAFSIAPPPGT